MAEPKRTFQCSLQASDRVIDLAGISCLLFLVTFNRGLLLPILSLLVQPLQVSKRCSSNTEAEREGRHGPPRFPTSMQGMQFAEWLSQAPETPETGPDSSF